MGRNVLAIDPGKIAGWAIFRGGKLQAAGVLKEYMITQEFRQTCLLHEFDEIVIEIPQVYPQKRQPGNPNHLIKMAFDVGEFAGRLIGMFWTLSLARFEPEIVLVKPHEWKGSVPKDIHNQRICGSLSEHESAIIDAAGVAKTHRHNMIDAVGLGLWRQ